MSGKLVSLALDFPVKMDPSRKLVLVTIADHANERDGCLAWPSNATLSKRPGIGERQVQEHRIALESQGLITLFANARGGRGKAKIYRLELGKMLRELAAVDPKKAAVHFGVLRKIIGALPLGFVLQKPGGFRANPGDLATKTRRRNAGNPAADRYRI